MVTGAGWGLWNEELRRQHGKILIGDHSHLPVPSTAVLADEPMRRFKQAKIPRWIFGKTSTLLEGGHFQEMGVV